MLMRTLALATVLCCQFSGSSTRVFRTPLASITSIVFIGNSLTLVTEHPALGWLHASGMAATNATHDYAHLVAAGIGVDRMSVSNFAALERNPDDPVNAVDLGAPVPEAIARHTRPIDASTLVVVQLGDNVPLQTLPDFMPRYRALLASTWRGKLVCVSTWWAVPEKDQAMQAACAQAGGRYVYIGDLYTAPDNVDRRHQVYANLGVDHHPQDWGMRRIADRILYAVGGARLAGRR